MGWTRSYLIYYILYPQVVFRLQFLAHWRSMPLITGINMSKKVKEGILFVSTEQIIFQTSGGHHQREGRNRMVLISDWIGYVKPLVRYEITPQKYAVRRQLLIFNQHICLSYKKSWKPANLLQEIKERFNCFYNPNCTHPWNEIPSTVEKHQVSGNIVIMSEGDRCDYFNSWS